MSKITFPALCATIFFLGALIVPTTQCRAKSPDQTVTVANVVDGDTIAVRIDGVKESVRLIGIDTPESRVNKRAALQAERSNKDIKTIVGLGKQASEMMRTLVSKGSELRLEFDVRRRDKYGRLLVYAYRPDGVMLNEEMLVQGYAQLLTMPPNVRYVERFKAALEKSKKAHRGLWAGGGFQN